MTSERDAKIAALRQRRGRAFVEAEAEAARLLAALSEQAAGIRSDLMAEAEKIGRLMASVQCQVLDTEVIIGNLRADAEGRIACLDANDAFLRRLALRAGLALGVAILAAGIVVLVSVWAGAALVREARAGAGVTRAGNLQAVADARAERERALATLQDELAAQRVELGIEEIGVELAGFAAEQAAFRAELTDFVALRDQLGIELIATRRQPVIIVPEGREFRLWRAARLHELARYNGRLYRVVERECSGPQRYQLLHEPVQGQNLDPDAQRKGLGPRIDDDPPRGVQVFAGMLKTALDLGG